ncbi:hypothetical protein QQF64_030722 [Cirrhinus molitorella]|uniref:Uncharacterized protein n=1 Tax=Cirrhinus molitorella TaxID=172907 RepID=A0ABR3N4C8_9TELE
MCAKGERGSNKQLLSKNNVIKGCAFPGRSREERVSRRVLHDRAHASTCGAACEKERNYYYLEEALGVE